MFTELQAHGQCLLCLQRLHCAASSKAVSSLNEHKTLVKELNGQRGFVEMGSASWHPS